MKTHILNSMNQSQDKLTAFLPNADNITNIENGALLLIGALKRYLVDTVKVEVAYRQQQLVIQGIFRVSLMTLAMNIFSYDI
mgnify:FL=1